MQFIKKDKSTYSQSHKPSVQFAIQNLWRASLISPYSNFAHDQSNNDRTSHSHQITQKLISAKTPKNSKSNNPKITRIHITKKQHCQHCNSPNQPAKQAPSPRKPPRRAGARSAPTQHRSRDSELLRARPTWARSANSPATGSHSAMTLLMPIQIFWGIIFAEAPACYTKMTKLDTESSRIASERATEMGNCSLHEGTSACMSTCLSMVVSSTDSGLEPSSEINHAHLYNRLVGPVPLSTLSLD